MENSVLDGYVTEKIFNPFFSRVIPIYNGSPNIDNYINPNAFIWVKEPNKDLNVIKAKILKLKNSEEEYSKMLKCDKIAKDYDNENYDEKLFNFIKKFDNEECSTRYYA